MPDAVHAVPVEKDQRGSETSDLGGVTCIDTHMGGYEGITSSYLIESSAPCLIETGTARSAPTVINALHSRGITSDDLAWIVVTHIHLDHAGGVGDLARAFPQARIAVHANGARHLADPSRLVASAHRVFGEAMDRLFGDLLPTDPERLVILDDAGALDLGDGRRLDTFHNPGHAKHHVALVDSATGDLYTGDAAGVFVPDTGDYRPATPPPDFDLDLALASLARMRAVAPTRLLFSHFGPVTEVDHAFDRAEAEMNYWVEQVTEYYNGGFDLDHAIARVAENDRLRHPEFFANDDRIQRFEELSSTPAQVSGIWHWLERTQPRP